MREEEDVEDKRSPSLVSEKRKESNVCHQMTVSLFVVVGVATAWVSSTQFSKVALLIDKKYFFAPYFMMWLNTNFMMSCFPVYLLYAACKGVRPKQAFRENKAVLGSSLPSAFLRVLLFLFLWSAANYAYLRALGHLSASVATSIASCNTAMVYLLAIRVLGDQFVPLKFLSVLLAIAGVVLISMDGDIAAESVGVLIAVGSAAFAATYKVLFKRLVGSASLGEVSLFMTCLGGLNLVLNAVPAFSLIYLGVETLKLDHVPWLPLMGSGSLNLCFNFLINFGIALLHPLVISVGMLCGLPLNTMVDIILGKVSTSTFFISGSLLLIMSFIIIILPNNLLSCHKSTSKPIQMTVIKVEEEEND